MHDHWQIEWIDSEISGPTVSIDRADLLGKVGSADDKGLTVKSRKRLNTTQSLIHSAIYD